ncbi:MAG: glutathione S-transferase family protein [Betaproteobacteria bacterium]|nr:MAG: glutathione S-transferase family protein [Betaproteobacteria bacterium]
MIQLWELRGREDRRYSLFSWRTRMALRHKELEFESTPVAMSDKATIAFSGGKTVPVIKDGDTVVRDSWRIAEYLEERYPDRPSLFGGAIGRGVTHTFNTWVDRAIVPAMLPVIVADVHERVDPVDEEYFRRQFEGFLKCTLEEARERAPQAHERLKRVLEPLEAALKRQPYVCGAAPAYADYILFSVVQWARIMSPRVIFDTSGALYGWRSRILDLYDAFARNVQTG